MPSCFLTIFPPHLPHSTVPYILRSVHSPSHDPVLGVSLSTCTEFRVILPPIRRIFMNINLPQQRDWKVYSLEYADMLKVFFTPHHVGHCCAHMTQSHCRATCFKNDLRRLLRWCCNQDAGSTGVSSPGVQDSRKKPLGATIGGNQPPTKKATCERAWTVNFQKLNNSDLE